MKFISIIFLFSSFCSFAQNAIELNEDNLGKSLSKGLSIKIDRTKSVNSNFYFKSRLDSIAMEEDLANMGFTNARFYLHLKIVNHSRHKFFYFTTGRAITNKVILFQIENKRIIKTLRNGDDFDFSERQIKNKNPYFGLSIDFDEEKEYLILLESDGEMLTVPTIFYSEDQYFETFARSEFLNGGYFGILMLVVILFISLYFILKKKLFLIYSLYSFALFITQFAIDGYLHQYIFPNNSWLSNHLLLFAAGFSSMLCLVYGMKYLEFPKRFPKATVRLQIFVLFNLIVTIFSLFDGFLYEISFPIINIFAFVGLLLVNLLIYITLKNSYKVTIFFILAFNILLLGAVIFILGNFGIIKHTELSDNALKICSTIEILSLSIVMTYKYREIIHFKNKNFKQQIISQRDKNIFLQEAYDNLVKTNDDINFQNAIQRTEINGMKEEVKKTGGFIDVLEKMQGSQISRETDIFPNLAFYKNKNLEHSTGIFIGQANTTIYGKKTQNIKLLCFIDVKSQGLNSKWKLYIVKKIIGEGLGNRGINSPAEALNYSIKRLENLEETKSKSGLSHFDIGFCGINLEGQTLTFAGINTGIIVIKKIKVNIPKTQNFIDEIEHDNKQILLISKPVMISDDLSTYQNYLIPIAVGDQLFLGNINYSSLSSIEMQDLTEKLIIIANCAQETRKLKIEELIEAFSINYNKSNFSLLTLEIE